MQIGSRAFIADFIAVLCDVRGMGGGDAAPRTCWVKRTRGSVSNYRAIVQARFAGAIAGQNIYGEARSIK